MDQDYRAKLSKITPQDGRRQFAARWTRLGCGRLHGDNHALHQLAEAGEMADFALLTHLPSCYAT